jgi:hypothetical protein
MLCSFCAEKYERPNKYYCKAFKIKPELFARSLLPVKYAADFLHVVVICPYQKIY